MNTPNLAHGAAKKKSNRSLPHYGVFSMKKPKKATHLDIWGSYWRINKHGFSFHDGKMWILCSNNRIWRDHLKNGNIFEVWCTSQLIEVCVMFWFLKRLFCIHQYDYESDIFVQVECRKCSKIKKWKTALLSAGFFNACESRIMMKIQNTPNDNHSYLMTTNRILLIY